MCACLNVCFKPLERWCLLCLLDDMFLLSKINSICYIAKRCCLPALFYVPVLFFGVYTWIFIGYKFLSRANFGLISDHFLEIYPFQNKHDHFKKKHATSCFHFWVMMNLPGNFRPFPGYFRLFPGNFRQKNRHIFTQSRVRSAQKARNPKLTTTIIKKWPFPAPSQEIRPKGRNLGNGHLFVSFRRSRYIYIYTLYIYIYTIQPMIWSNYCGTQTSNFSIFAPYLKPSCSWLNHVQ